MKRKTLDAFFVAGGFALAILLLVLGLVLQSNASFAKDYVRDQLSDQKITFTPADNLNEEEKKAECLVDNGGKALTSGKQAECYANEYIGLHVREATGGETYASLGGPQRQLRTQIEEATAANDTAKVTELQAQLDKVNGQRETAFKGETLRGLLLTSYGFSVFGDKAAQAATVAFVAAAVLLLASVAGLVHRLKTPDTATVG